MPTNLENKQDTSIFCKFSLEPIEQILADDRAFAVVTFQHHPRRDDDLRHFTSDLISLSEPDIKEVWCSNKPVKYDGDGNFYWVKTDEIMLLGTRAGETDEALDRQIYQQYRCVLAFLQSQGYPQLARMWNTMADINRGEGDLGRYRRFCLGRHRAFVEAGYGSERFPAASAVGSTGTEIGILLITSRQACIHFENPQQVSAYRYPREHGPVGPSFARATFLGSLEDGIIFLSGTASIVGHETRNKGDIEGQLSVMLENLDELTRSIKRNLELEQPLRPDLLKVYIRNRDDAGVVRERIQHYFGAGLPVIYLLADICRPELLVEAEGVCHLPSRALDVLDGQG